MIISLISIFLWLMVGGFDWIFDSIECFHSNSDLLNQIKEGENIIKTLTNNLITKDLLIIDYKKEILDWTYKYNTINEQLDLTKHMLNMANEALNNITIKEEI